MFIQNVIYVIKINWLMFQSVTVHYLAIDRLRKYLPVLHMWMDESVNGKYILLIITYAPSECRISL